MQRVTGQAGVLAAPSPPCFCSHRGAASCAGAWCWQDLGGWLSLWAGKVCPSPGRDAPHPFLAAHHRRAQDWPQKGSGQGPGPAARRSQGSVWLNCWGAGECRPGSRTTTETQSHHGQKIECHRAPATTPWQGTPELRGHPSTGRRRVRGVQQDPAHFYLSAQEKGARPHGLPCGRSRG